MNRLFRRLYSISYEHHFSDMARYPPERIRNFCIVAHVDHGKSTLADRLMELTGAIRKGNNKQILDRLEVEKERGITVKAQTISMIYEYLDGKKYLLNLIDTPGHVDFSFEVSRSMMACQGGLLIVDASQGIQAQTLANFDMATENGLELIPVLNKIDLPHADPDRVAEEVSKELRFRKEECIRISAKTGNNIDSLLNAIVEKIPPPEDRLDESQKILLFDSWFDQFRGVVTVIYVKQGTIKKGDWVKSATTGLRHQVNEIGILLPHSVIATDMLKSGQVGYAMFSPMKEPKDATLGDIFFSASLPHHEPADSLRIYKPQPNVFAGIFPISNSYFVPLKEAIEKLTLNDGSIQVTKTTSNSLGMGFRCGFLGMLHMDVFRQRLQKEFDIDIILTNPSVSYNVLMKNGDSIQIDNPANLPNLFDIKEFSEPVIPAKIVLPEKFLGSVIQLCEKRRGLQQSIKYLDMRVVLNYDFPLSEVVENNFFGELKKLTSGYATLGMDINSIRFVKSDVIKLDVLLNGDPIDALSALTHRASAIDKARDLAKRLHNVIDRQLFEVNIQVCINGKSVARETIKALRKNVTAKCYGGDVTRKMKLLEKQKEGKKKMKTLGKIEISPEAFLTLVQNDK